MSRRALIIGINKFDHDHISDLSGCVHDAKEVNRVLEKHAHTRNEERNFTTELITSDSHITNKIYLRDRIEELFNDTRELSLLYISSHGYIENTGGYIVTSDCKRGDEGISMNDILIMANASTALNRIIILDCCHAGGLGRNSLNRGMASVSEGVTIISASAEDQYSVEKDGSGVFTSLLIHALEGGAANLLGEISAGNIYGYIDKAMGETGQRPVFISNVRRYDILRKVHSQIEIWELREITRLFNKGVDMSFSLDPSYEPTSAVATPDHVEDFALLQKYNRVNLVVPVGADHMYFAAMEGKSCKLTSLGKSYWVMVHNDII